MTKAQVKLKIKNGTLVIKDGRYFYAGVEIKKQDLKKISYSKFGP